MKKLLVLLFMNVALLSAQDFYADTTEGECPLKVKFKCEGFFGLVHIWEFGDGEKYQSDQMDCIHTYTTPGIYTVTLRVKGDDYLWDTIIKEDYIKVIEGSNKINEINIRNIYYYPNPCHDYLYFDRNISVTIYDMKGKIVVKSDRKASKFDVLALECGIYYVCVNDEKYMFKFIKR